MAVARAGGRAPFRRIEDLASRQRSMLRQIPLLSIVTWLPLVGAVVVAVLPARFAASIPRVATAWAWLAFAVSLALLGYNRITAKPGAGIVARAGKDPLIVAGASGRGRSVAFASDCGPHWAPPAFVEWKGYAPLWRQIAAWAAGRE